MAEESITKAYDAAGVRETSGIDGQLIMLFYLICDVSGSMSGALTGSQVFDSIAIRIDGPRAWDEHLLLSWVIIDEHATFITELRNGALNHRTVAEPAPGSTVFTLDRATLIGLVTTTLALEAAVADRTVTVDGDPADLHRLVGLLAPVDPDFAIVTP